MPEGKRVLTGRGNALKHISLFLKMAVSRHFWRQILRRQILSGPVAVAFRLIVKLVCFAGNISLFKKWRCLGIFGGKFLAVPSLSPSG